MSELASTTLGYMGTFITDYAQLWAIPIGIAAVGLVVTVVVHAIRNR